MSHEPVQERERPKSMLAAKSFSPTSDLAALQGWFAILAQASNSLPGLNAAAKPF